jgi:hypothetical protein
LGDKPIWRRIWKCNVPEKVRIFSWKALANSLATEDNNAGDIFQLRESVSYVDMSRTIAFMP